MELKPEEARYLQMVHSILVEQVLAAPLTVEIQQYMFGERQDTFSLWASFLSDDTWRYMGDVAYALWKVSTRKSCGPLFLITTCRQGKCDAQYQPQRKLARAMLLNVYNRLYSGLYECVPDLMAMRKHAREMGPTRGFYKYDMSNSMEEELYTDMKVQIFGHYDTGTNVRQLICTYGRGNDGFDACMPQFDNAVFGACHEFRASDLQYLIQILVCSAVSSWNFGERYVSAKDSIVFERGIQRIWQRIRVHLDTCDILPAIRQALYAVGVYDLVFQDCPPPPDLLHFAPNSLFHNAPLQIVRQ